ncbi:MULTISPECIES: LysR family transcriptional regulator [Synechococcaceae]|uniref:helix-turn-helix domain-containing protein n=1 Tax=Synechococcaceae TaxID=1890426 RepID=UPI000AAF7E72|nr:MULTISPECIES: LysR family transcriptional regulator [Synechococcaceae]MCT4364828.1 LysR family transcriptional regulator [Candidatus Regnicoccus frigidus MAG-AL1]MCT4368511.1 LysR family transcriptional regulator [Candidatus Regnicoccus frigidus MAG-AL2]TWB93765.1 hypothetical protein FB106_10343 [Synechococcus sp. Ace-Pa]
MAPESVSFRITRTAEDLAQTVSALSHRLVKLEQRLGTLELALDHRQEGDPGELAALTNVEGLLRDCRLLLDDSSEASDPPIQDSLQDSVENSVQGPEPFSTPLTTAAEKPEGFANAA